METNRESRLGHFLDFPLWQDAIKLLGFQVAQKEKNKHYNTLSMFYYEKLGAAVDVLRTEDYYRQKVSNNLFYGLEKEFAVLPYVIPKSGLGLRNYKFLTYPMRALYYAVGLYLLKLSQEFLTEYATQRKHIRSYYLGFGHFSANLDSRGQKGSGRVRTGHRSNSDEPY